MRSFSTIGLFGVAVSVFVIGGCAHSEPIKPKSEPAPAAPAPQPVPVAASSSGPAPCSNDLACPEGSLCLHAACVKVTPELEECALTRVHFEFSVAEIKPDDLEHLQRMARCLKADHQLHVMIEGNADERGTEEYNMALGGKRASNVERYLESQGASRKQLDTISYGYEKPLCTEHDEACWAKNRRAALRPSEEPAKPVKTKK